MGRVSDAWKRAEAENLEVVSSAVEAVRAADTPSCASPSPGFLNEVTGRARPEVIAAPFHSNQASESQEQWTPDAGRMVFLNGNSIGQHEAAAEQFRGVSSHLYKIRQARPITSILISSARSREGRTFVAVNLAHALAQQPDKRVLLIDGDLRNPALHSFLGTQSEPGLSDYLAGKVDAPAVIRRGPIRGLYFIPGGAVSNDAAELLANGRLKGLLKRAASFDWVVVDSPPTSAACDASIMAEACDGILLVVEATKTPSDMAEKAVRQFRGGSMLGVVVNRSDAFHFQS
jgi:protein-tyrosine kinase